MRKHRLRDKVQIAVIGGNGFLGRAIIHRLSSYENLRIFSIDKREHGVSIDTSKSKAIIQQITMDVGNEGAISSWLATYPVDVIVFCAGYEHPTDGLSASAVEDTKALMALHRTLAGLPSMELDPSEDRPYFLFVSSWSVYGPQKKKLIDEGAKEFPANHSGMNKLLCEDLVKRMCTKFGSPFCILRPTEVYGRRHFKELSNRRFWPGYLAYFVDKVVKREKEIEIFSPNALIDLVPVNYFTKVVVEFIKDKKEGIYNISSGNPIRLEDLFNKIVDSHPAEELQIQIKKSKRLKIEDMKLSNSKVTDLVPYNKEKYDLGKFLKAYLPVRQYEIGKQMAIEQALKEPVTLDIAALQAKSEFEKRKKKRALGYKKIKEVAGPQFFKLRVGRIQERSQELLGEEYIKDKLIAETLEKVTIDQDVISFEEGEPQHMRIPVKHKEGTDEEL